MNNKIRVLMMTNGFNQGTGGGIAAFCNNYFQAIDKKQFEFDFLTIAYQAFEIYRESIEAQGGNLACLGVTSFKGIKGKISYMRAFKEYLKQNSYDIIHINMGSFFTVFLCSLVAKKYGRGAKVIAHSHSNLIYTGINKIAVRLAKPFFPKVADYFLACSTPAGKYMFPNKVLLSDRYGIMKNAIDISNFLYDENQRLKLRQELGLRDEIVIGHVGRFSVAKNHLFLVNVFDALVRIHKNSKLLLVGAGELQDKVREMVNDLGLEQKVIFTGLRNDVFRYLQVMDVFVLPSLFEGLSVVAIEAQASGLPLVASDNMPPETGVTELYSQVSLEKSPAYWAEHILKRISLYERINRLQDIKDAGYDIYSEAKKLGDLYSKLSKENF